MLKNPVVFERAVSSLTTKELILKVSDGDTPRDVLQEVCKELDKRKVDVLNVNSHV
jgi:hypothetical protein